MGLNGIVVVFPTGDKPPENPDATARLAIEVFEKLGLLRSGTADLCERPKPYLGRFAEERNRGEFPADDYALFIVHPDRLLPAMGELVCVFKDQESVEPDRFELPYLEFSVIKKALPIISGYDGRTLCKTWATIEFSYEDARYNPEIHRIRNPKHDIFAALEELVFHAPVTWDVDIG
jgi:hypothetical protein